MRDQFRWSDVTRRIKAALRGAASHTEPAPAVAFTGQAAGFMFENSGAAEPPEVVADYIE